MYLYQLLELFALVIDNLDHQLSEILHQTSLMQLLVFAKQWKHARYIEENK
jgi:hypothetical protein